jgi:hypothetical protein
MSCYKVKKFAGHFVQGKACGPELYQSKGPGGKSPECVPNCCEALFMDETP